MIQTNELRIGNWVLLNNTFKRVLWFKYNKVCVMNEYPSAIVDIDRLNSILLTEEILLKCGFEKSTDIDCYDINKLDNVIIYSIKGLHQVIKYSINNTNDYHLSINNTNDYCEYGYYVHTSKEIKYLHQLQNLYFALVGTELEIEL